MRVIAGFAACVTLCGLMAAVSKPHVVTLGKWSSIRWQDENEGSYSDLKIRALSVDGKLKELTFGPTHDVTDRTFAVQRVFRLNDSLPQESGSPRWRWEKGGWLLVDRMTGKVQQIAMPDFESSRSAVNWFRDYAAYCGISDDGVSTSVIVVQLGRRKPLLKKTIVKGDQPGCAPPSWQRDPVRVIFATKNEPKLTFTVKSRALDPAPPSDEGEE